MIVLLSPSKTMDFRGMLPEIPFREPRYQEKAGQLIKELRSFSPSLIQNSFGISQALVEKTLMHYREWTPNPSPENSRPAIFAFRGDVYIGLNALDFEKDQVNFADQTIRILSGLYGLLRPCDWIQAYRLEMGIRLPWSGFDDLYVFWAEAIRLEMKNELSRHISPLVVNLASEEYFGVIEKGKAGFPVITPVFMEFRNGKYKIVSFFAKKARGMMGRFIVQNRIENPEDMKAFQDGGYHFNSMMSSVSRWVFSRNES